MLFCEKCKVNVRGQHSFCPLCHSRLSGEADEPGMLYPSMLSIYKQYELFFKILFLSTVSAAICCIAVNLLIPESGYWSVLVLLGVICFWILLIVALRKRNNIPKIITQQVVLISLLSVLWDLITGWNHWSLDYVIPIACIIGIIALMVIGKVLKLPTEEFLICFFADIIFGIIPIIFYLTNIIDTVIPTVICVALSLIFLIFILLFEGKNIKLELEKRLHL